MSEAELALAFAAARAAGRTEGLALLFARAASLQQEPRARAFMLTQAHALGLEAGLGETREWHAELVRLGAEKAEAPAGS